ncbi:MAG: lysostaphin resistance A-like protein [Promethearchaeota archaeon]
MEPANKKENKIVLDRMRFFVEVVIIFFGIFLFMLIPRVFLPFFIDENSIFYGPLYYILRAVAIFIAIPAFLFLSNKILETQKKNVIIEEDITPSMEHLKLYSINKDSFKDQLLIGILLLFIIFIPLDFLIYLLFPGMLEYSGVSLTSHATDSYLLKSYTVFIISVIIIQICVSIYEESLTRGFLTKRGSDYFHKISAVLISSLYFGLMHFAYYFNPISKNYPIWYPFIWFLQTFFVAILLAIVVLRKKKLFPVIFAHAINNIISAHAIWSYLQGNEFIVITVYLYIPLLIISVVLFIWQFPRIKESVSNGFKDFKTYFKIDNTIGESKGELYFRILFDFLIAILILAIGLFIFGI